MNMPAPVPSQSPMGGAPMGGAMGEGAGGAGQQPSPEEVKALLIQIITEAKKMASQYGIDFQSLVGSSGSAPSVPPPPSSQAM